MIKENLKGWLVGGGKSELPSGTWVHVCVAVSKRNVNCFVGWKKNKRKELREEMLMAF